MDSLDCMFRELFDAGYKELKRVEKVAKLVDAKADYYKAMSDDELRLMIGRWKE